ncbi:hypothetical protein [Sphingomonas sp. GM_Shp_1]|uniref:hypothetical protein n=1 Tax=Sphingomonas sp. GM_Shp_1 TaxID=2937381 RepID=UPI00226B8658|nr:hypothetical protein [Sphingomonas sp. GM_Shp_1]
MTGYRDGYDFRKWYAASIKQRPRRHWLRWGLAGSMLVSLVATALHGANDHPPLFFSFLPGFFMGMSPFAKDSWATGQNQGAYDEFEHAALLRATARAFAAYIGLVVMLVSWMITAPGLGWPIPTTPMQWTGWLVTLSVIGISLPATFAEFMVPMPDAEDETL